MVLNAVGGVLLAGLMVVGIPGASALGVGGCEACLLFVSGHLLGCLRCWAGCFGRGVVIVWGGALRWGGRVQCLFFKNFLLVLAEFWLWGWGWAPGYTSMAF